MQEAAPQARNILQTGSDIPLDPNGWKCNDKGVLVGGQLQSKGGKQAYFKHSQAMTAIVRMRVEEGSVSIGFGGQHYDPERPFETYGSTARVWLDDGSTRIFPDLSRDGEEHHHHAHLGPLIPKSKPFDVALRCDPDGHVPQIQFNENDVWHDFSPEEGRGALKAGPWFLCVMTCGDDRISGLRVDRSWSTKRAGKLLTDLAAAGGAGAAAADEDDDSGLPLQKKSRNDGSAWLLDTAGAASTGPEDGFPELGLGKGKGMPPRVEMEPMAGEIDIDEWMTAYDS